MTERTALARTRSGRVRVTAPSALLTELAGLVDPFVELVPDDGAAPELPSVRVDAGAPDGPGWRAEVLRSAYEPDRTLWVHEARRAVALTAGADGWGVQQLLRSVRHLLRWQAYAAGDLLLHGGLVVLDGRGVGFVGGKRSGKTSNILSALVNGGADFVSNDDLTVADGTDGRLIGYGSPRTVNVRTDSLLALAAGHPGLAGLLAGAGHPTNAYDGRHRTGEALRDAGGALLPGSIWVRAGELAAAAGCALVAQCPVDVVVLPAFTDATDGPTLTRLGRDDAARALTAHVEREGTKYDPFLARWFPHTDDARRRKLVERLLDEVPCYRLTQRLDDLAAATALLRRELAG
ncbi:hypothetical protein [Micromonospora auratinigra]|uniref:HprK-related kinase B n=1 Tax=Micromonospora auratinigra TaxID=261654 RepID=A0A1A8ZD41_9ACTN|nr:hypothetical protein [Micromonospora auratinigra]SBT41805.1 hypothetical protein GA0070611_1751 [Micromonospora auratinigra]